MKTITLQPSALEDANTQAAILHERLSRIGIIAVNILGSPGSGKTTFLEALVKNSENPESIAVINGDLFTSHDAERLEALHVQAIELNTEGATRLDAPMILKALDDLDLFGIEWLFIENVGDLVTPADYSLGEHLRVLIYSVTEGSDKPSKYPAAFSTSNIVFINKIDLIPFTNFDLKYCSKGIHAVKDRKSVV